jgi:hypothetical protein
MKKNPKEVFYKDGTSLIIPNGVTWEYEADPDYEKTQNCVMPICEYCQEETTSLYDTDGNYLCISCCQKYEDKTGHCSMSCKMTGGCDGSC